MRYDEQRITAMNFAPAETWIDELTTFLLSRPTEEEVIALRPSEALNAHLHELLDKNREGELSDNERAELDRFLNFDHIFTFLKAKARLKLAGKL